MGERVMGRGALLLIVGVHSSVAVAIGRAKFEAEQAYDRERREALRLEDGGPVYVGMDLSRSPDLVTAPGVARPLGLMAIAARRNGKTLATIAACKALKAAAPMPDEPRDSRPWVALNQRHQRRAGLRGDRLPRVICPA